MQSNVALVLGIAMVMLASAAPSMMRREATTKIVAAHDPSVQPFEETSFQEKAVEFAKATTGETVTQADLGETMCKFCAKKFNPEGRFEWDLCLKEEQPWSGVVTIDSERPPSRTCFAPFWAPKQGFDSGRNKNRDDRIGLQGNSVAEGSAEPFCNCMHKMLDGYTMNGELSDSTLVPAGGCKDGDCVKKVWCACGGTCDSFKQQLECPAILAQSLVKRRATLSSNTSEDRQTGLDETLDEKCAA